MQVNLWDLRGGSSGTVHFGSGGVYHHPLLDSVNLRLALALVPGLASQTAIPASGVQWLQVSAAALLLSLLLLLFWRKGQLRRRDVLLGIGG